MKFASIVFPFSILLISFTSCHKGKIGFVNGKGEVVPQTRNVSGFNEIDLDIDAKVIFIEDSIYSVVVSAQSNLLKVIETKVDDHVLEIEYSKNVWKHKDIVITVHAPSLRGLELSGSGRIEVQNTLHTNSLDIEMSGSGDISIPTVETQELEINISGSGNIAIGNGNSVNTTCRVSGSGNILLPMVLSQSGKATISGSGNIQLHVVQYLSARISGSGDISYRGFPAVDVHISGSGHLYHLD